MSSLAVVPVPRSIIYLGMDVHKDSMTIAVLPQGAKAPTRLERLANDLPKLQTWLDRGAREGEVHACDEASGAGYVLPRALRDWADACEGDRPVSDPDAVRRASHARQARCRRSRAVVPRGRAGARAHPERGGRARA